MSRTAHSPVSRISRWALVGVALATLAACGPKIRVSDSIDTKFDLRRSPVYDDQLHSPYVAGATFEIYAYDISEDNDLDGWTVRTRDPEVLEVDDVEVIRDDLDPDDDRKVKTDIIVTRVTTTGPGTGALEIVNRSDKVVREVEVVVMQPDRIELRAAGPLFIGEEDVAPSLVDTSPKVMADGTATFLIQWFAGEELLRGPGALGLSSEHPNVDTLWTLTDHFDEQREWAQLRFTVPEVDEELAEVEVLANGVPVQTLEFEIVRPETIESIEITSAGESSASDGDLVAALALAYDGSGESIWGVGFDWDIDGRLEGSEGDLFRYWYEPGASSVLGAEFGEARGEVPITGERGFVDSSNDISDGGSCFCSASRDRPARGVGWSLLSVLALGLVRRRRGAGAPSTR